MSHATLFSEIVLRRRSSGHLRFQLPDVLCGEELASFLEQGLHQLEGVRRVTVYREQRKLSIFYMETVCNNHQVIRKLGQLIELLLQEQLISLDEEPATAGWGGRLKERVSRPFIDLKERIDGWRRQAKMAKTLLDTQWQINPALRLLGDNPEKAAIGFINDIVTFYLIKVHWDLVVGKWLKSPIRHRYEWLAIFYFVFLLVRSRKK
jgi:hypothetical protein